MIRSDQQPRSSEVPRLKMPLLASIVQGSCGLVTDRAGAQFRGWCLFGFRGRMRDAARCAQVRTGSDRAGMILLSR
jgi:hypothetical protein